MRVLAVIHDLGCGGAESLCSLLVRDWHRRGYTVAVALTGPTRPAFNVLPSDVVVTSTFSRSRKVLRSLARFAQMVRSVFNGLGGLAAVVAFAVNAVVLNRFYAVWRPDVVVAFLGSSNLPALAAACCSSHAVPVIATCCNWPPVDNSKRVYQRLFYRSLYARAASLAVHNERTADWYRARVESPVVVIPNGAPVVPSGVQLLSDYASEPVVLAVGRLTVQKGFDILLAAFALAAASCGSWRLVIVGDGDEDARLQALAARLGIRDRVDFPGAQHDLWPYYARARIFALSSRHEGCPLVLREAMAAGLPVVATDCPSGPAEILCDGVTGLLVPPEDSLNFARALVRLMSSSRLRCDLGAAARDASLARTWSDVTADWTALLKRVAARVGAC